MMPPNDTPGPEPMLPPLAERLLDLAMRRLKRTMERAKQVTEVAERLDREASRNWLADELERMWGKRP